MQIIIKIIGMAAISVVYGSLTAGLAIIYLRTGEKIQYWSEKYSPPKKWSRRSLHLILCILALLVLFYGFLFWASIVAKSIKGLSEDPGLKTLFFIFFTSLFCCPFFFLRRQIFREMSVKKIWE